MKNKQYVMVFSIGMLCSTMTSWAMDNNVPSYPNLLEEPSNEWNAFKSIANDNSEEEPPQKMEESSDSEGTNSSEGLLNKSINFISTSWRGTGTPTNNKSDEQDSKANYWSYFNALGRKLNKSTSWALPKQMVGALRNNYEEIDKTILLINTIQSKLEKGEELSAEELKQYDDRTSYANNLGLLYARNLAKASQNDTSDIDAKELGDRLTLLNEANQLIRFARSGYDLLTPLVKNQLDKDRKKEKKCLQPLVQKKVHTLSLLEESLRRAAEDSDDEE